MNVLTREPAPAAPSSLTPPPFQHDYFKLRRFLERLSGTPAPEAACIINPALAELRFDFAFYTDDKTKLAAAHAYQRATFSERRAADPSYRLGKSATFDPASRGHRKSHLTIDEVWPKILTDNVPARATGITLRINESDGQGVRNANFVRSRAFFVDADTREAVVATIDFIRRSELSPSLIVCSSIVNAGGADEWKKMHVYWLVAPDQRARFSLERWSLVQAALADTCRSDASLADFGQAMRLPGTLNLKNPGKPCRVALLYADGPDYSPDAFVRRAGLDLRPRQKRAASGTALRDVNGKPLRTPQPKLTAAFRKHRAAIQAGIAADIGRNFTEGVLDSVDVRACATFCPAIRESIATAGAEHSEPLWFTMIGLAVFDHNPLACAVAMSSGHPGYSLAETASKLERAQATQSERNLGWTSCRTIAAQHPACSACYYRTGTMGPLSIAAKMLRDD